MKQHDDRPETRRIHNRPVEDRNDLECPAVGGASPSRASTDRPARRYSQTAELGVAYIPGNGIPRWRAQMSDVFAKDFSRRVVTRIAPSELPLFDQTWDALGGGNKPRHHREPERCAMLSFDPDPIVENAGVVSTGGVEHIRAPPFVEAVGAAKRAAEVGRRGDVG